MNVLWCKVTVVYIHSKHVSGYQVVRGTIHTCQYRHLSGLYKKQM